jgi:hypothetical protein
MFPDKRPEIPATPASLPPVQLANADVSQPAVLQQNMTSGAMPLSSEQELEQLVSKVKTLNSQYGSNPYAFSAAFEQLKARYLLDHYHVDPDAEKN